MDAAVLTGQGSFLTVCNDLPDKPLHFLLFSAPPTSPTSPDQLFPVVASPSSAPSPPLRREGEAYALFGHNGAVIAASEAAARARMRAFEDEGEVFGDPFAKAHKAVLDVPLRSLSDEPLVPERLDWKALGLEPEMERLFTASSSPTPPASPTSPEPPD